MIVYALEPTGDADLFNIVGNTLNRNGTLTPGQAYSVFVRRTDTATGRAIILPFTINVTAPLNTGGSTPDPSNQHLVMFLT